MRGKAEAAGGEEQALQQGCPPFAAGPRPLLLLPSQLIQMRVCSFLTYQLVPERAGGERPPSRPRLIPSLMGPQPRPAGLLMACSVADSSTPVWL